MIDFADLDMMARGGSIALLLLWSWLLVRHHWRVLAARVALLMNFGIICHVVATIGAVRHPPVHSPVNVIIELGAAAVPGAFWLFARTWFNDEARIGWRSWSLIGVALGLIGLQIVLFELTGVRSFAVGATIRTMMFGFAAAGMWTAWRGRDGDLIEARRRMRTTLIGAVGLYVIVTNAVEIFAFFDILPESSRTLIEFGIVALTFGFCAAMFTIGQPDLFASARPEAKPEARADDPAASALAERLRAHMEREKPHRDDTLTIAALAAQLGEQEYKLRRLINGEMGHRNFAAFLNGYRLAEVKSALRDPSQKEVPILTIALDAGFGSLGPFNRAFREAEGMTPSGYRSAAGASP